jgi:hypothetical protein
MAVVGLPLHPTAAWKTEMEGILQSYRGAWRRAIGIALLQGTIVAAWMVYNAYLPGLLESFGWPKSLALTLLVIENALAIALEPLMGGLSDRAFRFVGTKFGFISFGVILSSGLLILFPLLLLGKNLLVAVNWIVPILAVLWAMAMTIFRSPALSLLGRYGSTAELPLLTTVVTIVGGTIGAFRPVANKAILGVGPLFAFLLASVAMLAASWAVRYFDRERPSPTIAEEADSDGELSLRELGWRLLGILTMGVAVGWGTRCLSEILSQVLKKQLPDIPTAIPNILVIISLAVAATAIIAGWAATRWTNPVVMTVGAIALAVAALLLGVGGYLAVTTIAIAIIVFFQNWLHNGTIPQAIGLMPNDMNGLGVGTYFGGLSLANSVFGHFFTPTQPILTSQGSAWAIACFLGISIWLWVTRRNSVDAGFFRRSGFSH